MNKYKIVSGRWNDSEYTRAAVMVQVTEDGKEPYVIPYGMVQGDDAEMNKKLWEILQEDQKKENPSINLNSLREAGEQYKPNYAEDAARMVLEVRQRIDRLYSGYEQAMAERHPKRAENRKRKIDALLAADELPEWPYVDLNKIEEEA